MRSFRFPRSTIVLMILVLFGALYAIDRARMLSVQLGRDAAFAEPMPWWAFLGPLAMAVALTGAAAVAGYGVLLVLRKAGVQRLSYLHTWLAH
jgi:hypothetical protein